MLDRNQIDMAEIEIIRSAEIVVFNIFADFKLYGRRIGDRDWKPSLPSAGQTHHRQKRKYF
jgi:hypothetical protein